MQICSWQKPIEGHLKCNMDAAIFSDHARYGVSAVIRDHQGHFISAKSKLGFMVLQTCDRNNDPLCICLWITNLKLQNVIFESDNQLVVDKFNSSTYRNNCVRI
ncbi:hypothetical protein AAZX31_06G200100 [Glycine max]